MLIILPTPADGFPPRADIAREDSSDGVGIVGDEEGHWLKWESLKINNLQRSGDVMAWRYGHLLEGEHMGRRTANPPDFAALW